MFVKGPCKSSLLLLLESKINCNNKSLKVKVYEVQRLKLVKIKDKEAKVSKIDQILEYSLSLRSRCEQLYISSLY